jgi:hypothetical protein
MGRCSSMALWRKTVTVKMPSILASEEADIMKKWNDLKHSERNLLMLIKHGKD